MGKSASFVVAFVVAALVSAYMRGAFHHARPDFKHTTVGTTKVSLDVQGDMKSDSVDIPAAVKSKVEKFENYACNANDFEVGVTTITYVPDVNVDLKGAADGAVNNISHTDGVSDMKSTRTDTAISGLKAILVSGDFKRKGHSGEIRMLIFGKGQQMWMVQTVYEANDKNRADAKRVIDSVKYEG